MTLRVLCEVPYDFVKPATTMWSLVSSEIVQSTDVSPTQSVPFTSQSP